ncbi:DUF4879 domain-containing protein [Chromobacterium violaceum]|uniref:DUF4879 domain-containing protein n=1 Tax=Chromobacterium violaceum TaxID=536 RepID=UPI001B33992A|nr:DUF4879 domain-containing protein [Chromobacterium violaceum]MBP4045358.1 DUF4879 domain-containing protein [Chromobacterium violaceum]
MKKMALSAGFAVLSTLALAESEAPASYPVLIYNQDLPQKLIKTLPKTAPMLKAGDKAALSGDAPYLKSMQVLAVDSDRGGLEPYDLNALPPYETKQQHSGGTRLNIVTVEKGFGRAYAKYNGANVMSTDTAICQDWNGGWRGCQNGEIVGGWMRTWNVAGRGPGQFEAWSTSLNMPYNTYRVNLKVR